ncbi:hypothetical protein PMIN01_07514 [Paraphaeosphaeria minitans]|uniref:Uncharacterized protein n=1 Tax=Paraphaeosphaeria minitans TaxID=565426 RepID=A0A9P6GG79_9PLEO|nr:hypothetical protein PMIN01_07514 [Paraphaeosphaeria minitans]
MLSLLLQIPLVLSVTLGAPNPPYLSEDFPGDVAGYHNLAQAFAGNRSVVMDTPPVAKDQRNGNFFLVNQCKYDLYIWEAWKAHQSDPTKLIGGQGGNQLQFEFATKAGLIYFDISFVDTKNLKYRSGDASNCPSWAEGIRIEGQKPPQQNNGCDILECFPGDMCIHDGCGAYNIDEPFLKWGIKNPVKTCLKYEAGMELYFRTCTQEGDIPH